MIRPATLEDLDALVQMGTAFHASTPYGQDVTHNPEQYRILCATLITGEASAVFVVDRGGSCLGMIGVVVCAHPLSGEPVMCELFWWVNPEARGEGIKLLRTAERWGITHGARRLLLVAPNDRVAQLYERLGYHLVERAYQRNVA